VNLLIIIIKEFKEYCIRGIGAKIYPYMLLIKLNLFLGPCIRPKK